MVNQLIAQNISNLISVRKLDENGYNIKFKNRSYNPEIHFACCLRPFESGI
jgi:hypothetical protein